MVEAAEVVFVEAVVVVVVKVVVVVVEVSLTAALYLMVEQMGVC